MDRQPNFSNLLVWPEAENEKKLRTIVRVRTSTYATKNGLRVQRDVTTLRRKSDIDFLSEEIGAVGAEEAAASITNLTSVDDGIYELISVNHHTDWETGLVDDFDLELVPYNE